MAILRRLATILFAGAVAGQLPGLPAMAAEGGGPPHFAGISRPFLFLKEPEAVPDLAMTDAAGKPVTLADLKGKVVVLNVWATWCPPCVKEMPSLDRLQAALGGDRFEVVALSVDRGGTAQVEPFFRKAGVGALKIYLDPTMSAMRTLDLPGLPTSLLIDGQGREIGRLLGEADWDSDEAKAFLKFFIDREDARDGAG